MSASPPTKPNDSGGATDSVEPSGVAISKRPPPTWFSPLAVEKCAAAGTLTCAPVPKTIPAGLTNQKSALGIAEESSVPERNEVPPPVTRLMTWAMLAGSPVDCTQRAISPWARLKLAKLWNRLAPASVPPSMVCVPELLDSVVPRPRPGSKSGTMSVTTGTACAATGAGAAAAASAVASASSDSGRPSAARALTARPPAG